jgi:hypothetical protein
MIEESELGKILITKMVVKEVGLKEIGNALARYMNGDLGKYTDRKANDAAMDKFGSISAIYYSSKGTTFFITTRADRSETYICL